MIAYPVKIISSCMPPMILVSATYKNMTALFKKYIEPCYQTSEESCGKLFFWQKHILTAGVALSCLGAVYAWFIEQVAIRQFCILSGCIGFSGIYYQNFLEGLVIKMHMLGQELQHKLHCAEAGLEDRRLLLEELRISRKKQEELSRLIAELTTAVTFFTRLKELVEKGAIEEVSQKIKQQIVSVEKILEVAHRYFARNERNVAQGLLEVKNLLEAAHQKDLDMVAMLIKMDQKVSYLCDEMGTMKNSLEEIQHKVQGQ